MKISLDEIRSRLDTAEEQIKELEYIAIQASLNEAQREKRLVVGDQTAQPQ